MTLAAVRSRAAGLDITDAIESYRRNRRLRLSPQTLDRLYVPRLTAFAEWLREQGMPTELESIRREHIETYIEHLQTKAPGRSGAGQKSATVSIVSHAADVLALVRRGGRGESLTDGADGESKGHGGGSSSDHPGAARPADEGCGWLQF